MASVTGADLKQYRERRGLTQQAMADALNRRLDRRYGRSNVSHWENGAEGVPESVQRALSSVVSARVIAVTNQKGGVAKTTTAINLAYALASMAYRVLLVDADPQGNATLGSGQDPVGLDKEKRTLTHVLFAEDSPTPIQAAVQRCTHYDLLGASLLLARGELRARSLPGGDTRLKHALLPILRQYDFILVDTPPNLGPMTMNALAAAGDVLIPTAPAPFDVYGVELSLSAIDEAQRYLNPNINILGLLPTMVDRRNTVDRQQLQDLQERFGSRMVIFPIIPRATDMNKLFYNGEVPLAAVDDSHPISAYRQVARDIVNMTLLTREA
jgi:chromosome partitioning protein